MLTKRIAAGLIAVVLAFGGCAPLNQPPPPSREDIIRALILSKTPLGSNLSQVRAFFSRHDQQVVSCDPDHPVPDILRIGSRSVELQGDYFVDGRCATISWDFLDGRHLSDVQIGSRVQ